jgi:hypothetical protein
LILFKIAKGEKLKSIQAQPASGSFLNGNVIYFLNKPFAGRVGGGGKESTAEYLVVEVK